MIILPKKSEVLTMGYSIIAGGGGGQAFASNTIITPVTLNLVKHESPGLVGALNVSTYRITPQIAGKYLFNAIYNIVIGDSTTSQYSIRAYIYKNGIQIQNTVFAIPASIGAFAHIPVVTHFTTITLNGVTDYVDFRLSNHTVNGLSFTVFGGPGAINGDDGNIVTGQLIQPT